jgi:PKD repeat protein
LNVSISELNGSSEVVQADPSSSVVSSADSVTYLYKWGDGQSSSATVNAPVTHTYATPGTYEVTLDLSDTGGETSSASQSITTQTVPTKNYGEVAFGANTPVAGLVGLTTTLIVPAKPPAVGTLFLWPGIQPNPNSPSYNPIGNGVLQPVLTWGPSCAPAAQPTEYSTWWISGQYVNSTNPAYASDECSSGPAISVNVGDSLLINMTLSGTVWTQTITDMQTAQSTSFNYNLEGQQQGYLYFIIEEDSSAPITPVQFNNTTFTFSNSTGASCFPLTIGVNDTISAPQLKNNGTQCFVPSITLRAQGIN